MLIAKTKKLLISAIILSVSGLPLVVSAKTAPKLVQVKDPYTTYKMGTQAYGDPANGVAGVVTSITGTTLVIQDYEGRLYIADISKAKFMDGVGISGLSAEVIMVDDPVFVLGKITNGKIEVTDISDSSLVGRNIFSGTVTKVLSGSIVIQTSLKKNYSVDVTSARVVTPGKITTANVSQLAVGDRLMVIGMLNDGVVSATTINNLGKLQKKAAVVVPKKVVKKAVVPAKKVAVVVKKTKK